jgi:heme-degrading monooxygenase HmoA
VTNIKFPPAVGTELVRVAQGLTPILKKQRGFDGFQQVLTDPNAGEGIIISLWETEDAAKASEAVSAYIGQMSMLSSFLYGPLSPKTYEAAITA